MNYRDDTQISFVSLGLNKHEKDKYNNNLAYYNKKISRILSDARKRSKNSQCYVCKKQVNSFCNSHSVPQFCLRRIAVNGKVQISGFPSDFPYLGNNCGVNSAGTFYIICRECDSKIFQEYEKPSTYDEKPSGQVLAQIAMKNYLQMIYKRQLEQEIYSILEEKNPNAINADGIHKTQTLDLKEYIACYERARIASNGHHDNWYNLFYYKKLDYTVPMAFQGQVALVCDFDKTFVNNIYNNSPKYKIQDLQIAVFPLAHESVIMAFVDSRNKRYNNFIKKFKSLEELDQLSIINFIIFKYSENVFLSTDLPTDVLENPEFKNVCESTNVVKTTNPFANLSKPAAEYFDLAKHKNIPNLLSPEYALK